MVQKTSLVIKLIIYMKKRLFKYFSISTFFLFAGFSLCSAQPKLVKSDSNTLQIPNILTMVNSPTHLYVLSKSDGLIVFRAHQDSLQWLYSSPGMQKRGDEMTADSRFAYLFGNGKRLTVIEPTSLLGVYSSTYLSEPALDAGRLNNTLYLAMDSLGIGVISLQTPAAVDSTLHFIKPGESTSIIDLENTPNRLLALGTNNTIYEYAADQDTVKLNRQVTVNRNLEHIFLLNNELLGSTPDGNIYSIDNSGNTTKYFSVGEPVVHIDVWKGFYVIRSKSGQVWLAQKDHNPVTFRNDVQAGNYFTISKNKLWMSEYNQVNDLVVANSKMNASVNTIPDKLKLVPIKTQSIPYPHVLILALNTENNYPVKHLHFHYRSEIKSAKIKGSGFYWQPSTNAMGMHKFTIIATSDDGQTDSTSFMVHVRNFNQPPRFSPVQPMSIGVKQKFTLNFHAVDPDGSNKNLVRYLGVNLPQGAQIDEKTGEFTWTPQLQQVGKNTFRIIATDQYGAANSITVTLTVVNIQRQ